MSKAEYYAAFGIPMSDEDRRKCADRDDAIRVRWYGKIKPNLVLRPTIWQKTGLLFVKLQALPTMDDPILPRPELTTMSGLPLHLFKERDGVWYYYGVNPSPGFPGS